MPQSRLRRLGRVARFALYNLALVVVVVSLVHWRWLRRIPHQQGDWLAELSRASGLPIELVSSIGHYVVDRDRRDLRTLPIHRPDTIRIGAFGDSFTYGDEVVASLSFPAQLEELFRKDGFTNVEVINLGSSGQGFGQATQIWERFGRKLDLAFVLLGPACLFEDRDQTFNHVVDFSPDYLHGRFVLDGDGVRWIDPVEAPDRHDRFTRYFQLLSPWTYLRYDRAPPAVLRALLPKGRTVANPFYYSSLSVEAERDRLYRAIFERWLAGPSQVVFTHVNQEILRIAEPLHDRMPVLYVGAQLGSFHHRCALGHLSGAGNRIIAKFYHDVLLGRRPLGFDDLDVKAPSVPAPSRPLGDFAGAEVWFEDQWVARLEHAGRPLSDDKGRPVDFRADHVASLLAFGRKESFFDGFAITRTEPLRAGAVVELRLDTTHGERRAALGSPVWLDDHGAFGLVRSNAFITTGGAPTLQLNPWALQIPPAELRGGELLLDGKPILNLRQEGEVFLLVPVVGTLVAAKPQADTRLDLDRLPSTGRVRLVLRGEPSFELAAGRFDKQHHELPWEDTGLRMRLRPSATDPTHAEVLRR